MASDKNKKNDNRTKAPRVSFRETVNWYGIKRAIVFPALALFFIILIVVYHMLLMNYARRSIVESGENNAIRMSEGIEMYINSSRDTLERSSYIVENMLREGSTNEGILEYLTEETTVTENTDIVDSTGLYGYFNGQYLDGSGWDPGPDYDPTTRPWYAEAVVAMGQMVTVDPYLDSYSNEIIITLSESMPDSDNVIAIDVTLGEIQDIIDSFENHSYSMINMVVGRNGIVVAHTAPAEIGRNYLTETGTLGNAVFNGVLARNEQSFELEYEHHKYTVYEIPLSNEWHCISVVDSEVIYQPINMMVLLSVAAIFMTLVVFVIIMYRSGKREIESRRLQMVLSSSAGLYKSLCDFDLVNNRVMEFKNDISRITKFMESSENNAIQAFAKVMNTLPENITKQAAVEFADLTTVNERMKYTDHLTFEFVGFGNTWVRARMLASDRTADGKIRHVLWMLEDIEKEKEERDRLIDMSERAIAASEAKSAFLSNMSHEIRTPINAVLGMNEMIIRESSEPQIVSYAQNVKGAGNSLLGLINDILDFSKIESGKVEIRPVEYDLSAMLNDLVNMVKVRTDAKELELIVDIDPDLPKRLVGDDMRVKQIITNILTNAAKYTKEGYVKFSVTFENADDGSILLLVSVKDTGIGIKPEDLPKLFANFERLEEERNRNIEGTGLGLAITQNLLSLMDTKLEVDSVYGKGSTFSFKLRQGVADRTPIGDYRESFESLSKKENRYVPKFKASGGSILVVDDMMVNLVIMKGLLGKTGLSIDIADSGKRAIELTGRTKYDIVFLDHMMPEMDGIQTLEKIRQDESNPNRDSVFIVLTANAISGAREFYLENGFDDYLSKPIDSAALEEMVYNHLPKELIEE